MSYKFLKFKAKGSQSSIHTWTKDYVMHDVEPMHIFHSGNGETIKSHLVQVIYNAKSRILLYHWKDPEKRRVLLLGPTGISAINIYVQPPFIFFSIWVFFHEHSQITGLQGKGEGISLTPHYHPPFYLEMQNYRVHIEKWDSNKEKLCISIHQRT